MGTAKAREVAEQWIVPPEPALDRYLLRSQSRAANDNRRLFLNVFSSVHIRACIALISALTLIGILAQ